MKNIPPLFRHLRPVDVLYIAFTVVLSGIILASSAKVHQWSFIILINLFTIVAILLVSTAAGMSRFWRMLHSWYPVLAIFFLFKEVYVVIQSLGRPDWDDVLIAIDQTIFSVHPTIWLSQYSTPWLTEVLQISYASYYFIMLVVGIELFVREEQQRFSFVLFTIVYGFCLSYIGYLVFPAIGPRFTLHNFADLNRDLPGLWMTNPIRDVINAGESIPGGTINAFMFAQRDAFPSGHTQMTLISLYFATRYRLKTRGLITVLGTLLVVSTVYLRYHYVVDVIAGVGFMWFTIWTAPKMFAWWENLRTGGTAGVSPADLTS